jgi:hypothetical protein
MRHAVCERPVQANIGTRVENAGRGDRHKRRRRTRRSIHRHHRPRTQRDRNCGTNRCPTRTPCTRTNPRLGGHCALTSQLSARHPSQTRDYDPATLSRCARTHPISTETADRSTRPRSGNMGVIGCSIPLSDLPRPGAPEVPFKGHPYWPFSDTASAQIVGRLAVSTRERHPNGSARFGRFLIGGRDTYG